MSLPLTPEQQEYFVGQITGHQPVLLAYIRSLLPESGHANDVLQETNLVLWRRANEFSIGENFGGWARKVAYYQVLAFYRDHQREKLFFDAELVTQLAESSEQQFAKHDQWQTILKNCLQKLPEHNRNLIQERYMPGGSVQKMASKLDRSIGAISQSLYRIRELLRNCINTNIQQESGE